MEQLTAPGFERKPRLVTTASALYYPALAWLMPEHHAAER